MVSFSQVFDSTYRCTSLEDDGIAPRPRGVRKRTHCLGGFILVGYQKIVQALVSNAIEEPFAIAQSIYESPSPLRSPSMCQIA
jgi:hypothetical protein